MENETKQLPDPERVLLELWAIASADVSELVAVHVDCCRYCHGLGHAYQWTDMEYSRAVSVAIERCKPAPDGYGGFGFDPKRAPDPDCPECGGRGVPSVILTDTRKLSPAGRLLYAGAQTTKDGIKILTRDRDAALANIGRALGMFSDKKPGASPEEIVDALRKLSETLPV